MPAEMILKNSRYHLSLFEGQMADLHQRSETQVSGGAVHII